MDGRSRLAASLALAGGVAAAAGSFLPWVEFSAGPISERATGISGWEGKATLLASIVVIVAAVRVFVGADGAPSRLRASALMAGLAACGVCLYTAVTARDQLLDAAEADVPRAVVQNALDAGLLQLTWTAGFFVVIGGGALAIAAALVPSADRSPGQAGVGRGLDEWAAIRPSAGTGPTSPTAGSWGGEPATTPPAGPGPWADAATPPRPGTPPRPDVDPDAPS